MLQINSVLVFHAVLNVFLFPALQKSYKICLSSTINAGRENAPRQQQIVHVQKLRRIDPKSKSLSA